MGCSIQHASETRKGVVALDAGIGRRFQGDYGERAALPGASPS